MTTVLIFKLVLTSSFKTSIGTIVPKIGLVSIANLNLISFVLSSLRYWQLNPAALSD